MEIGSEFWLDNIPIEWNSDIPDWIEKFGNTVLTSSGRGAISLLLHEVQPKLKTALLPAYICNSVILPFIAQGYTCYFYDTNSDLTPDFESIVARGDIGIFLHMGYYGFPTNNGLLDIIKRFKTESTIIVEDITHTLFSNYQRFEENDYYMASIRKWMGLPSGGFLASPNRTVESTLRHNQLFANIRREAQLVKARYLSGGDEALKSRYLDLFAKGEAVLDSDIEPYHIDALSMALISMVDVNGLIDKRRANFKILSEGLKNVKYIESIFTGLPENICPLFYPIYIKKKRSEICQKLIEKNIYCPIHWPVPEQIECRHFENAANIYNIVLSIPCDQRYGVEDMKRVVSVLRGL